MDALQDGARVRCVEAGTRRRARPNPGEAPRGVKTLLFLVPLLVGALTVADAALTCGTGLSATVSSNLAPTCPSGSACTTTNSGNNGESSPPENGNDEVFDSCTTTTSTATPWWRVDLGASSEISEVTFYGSTTKNLETPYGYGIWIGDDGSDYDANTPCVTNQNPTRQDQDWSTTHTCSETLTGRYLFVVRPSSAGDQGEKQLGLCEIVVPGSRCEDGDATTSTTTAADTTTTTTTPAETTTTTTPAETTTSSTTPEETTTTSTTAVETTTTTTTTTLEPTTTPLVTSTTSPVPTTTSTTTSTTPEPTTSTTTTPEPTTTTTTTLEPTTTPLVTSTTTPVPTTTSTTSSPTTTTSTTPAATTSTSTTPLVTSTTTPVPTTTASLAPTTTPLPECFANSVETSAGCDCLKGYSGDGRSCEACLMGTYKGQQGSSACTDCSAGQVSSPGSFGSSNCTNNAVEISAELLVNVSSAAGLEAIRTTFVSTTARFLGLPVRFVSLTTSRRRSLSAALAVTLSRAEASSAASSLSSGLSAALVAGGLPATTVLSIAQSCGAGYQRSGSGCQVCPRGTYQESSGDSECIDCSGEETTVLTARTLASACVCPPGSGGEACAICASGTYKATSGTGTCTRCKSGTNTSSTGATSATNCTCGPGYQRREAGGACIQCPAGTYKNTTGDQECDECPDETDSLIVGGTSVEVCEELTQMQVAQETAAQITTVVVATIAATVAATVATSGWGAESAGGCQVGQRAGRGRAQAGPSRSSIRSKSCPSSAARAGRQVETRMRPPSRRDSRGPTSTPTPSSSPTRTTPARLVGGLLATCGAVGGSCALRVGGGGGERLRVGINILGGAGGRAPHATTQPAQTPWWL
ncbi:hypothetical protein T484DRAFT_2776125 [Baffinella frigidus]|nr:hypothetical protein T484DRAFT_2776125 [Cryptophyta sp. CCMP2293]